MVVYDYVGLGSVVVEDNEALVDAFILAANQVGYVRWKNFEPS